MGQTLRSFLIVRDEDRPRLNIFRQKGLSGHRLTVLPAGKTSFRRSILHKTCSSRFLIPHSTALRFLVRDGRIELPTSVWKTDVLPLN